MLPEIPSIALEEDTGALFIKAFPEELRRQLKSLAAAQGKYLRDYVIEVLSEHIRNVSNISSSPRKG